MPTLLPAHDGSLVGTHLMPLRRLVWMYVVLLVVVLATMPAFAEAAGNGRGKPVKSPWPTATPAPDPTPTPNATPTQVPSSPPTACAPFPATNVWNRPVNTLPVRSDSSTLMVAIGLTNTLHPDFSNAGGYGIPVNVTGPSTPRYPVSFYYPDESDPGPYPIPANPKIEGGSDRHLLSWDTSACYLYEIFDAAWNGSAWTGGSGAIWDLRSNALRPAGWTSADAAGLPILPGLVRFTAPYTARSYVYPARHQAGCTNNSRCTPPMGLRVRLKASVDMSRYSAANRAILTALKTYGMLLADNGSPWYITGVPDTRWNDDDLHLLGGISGADFEAVDTSGLVNG